MTLGTCSQLHFVCPLNIQPHRALIISGRPRPGSWHCITALREEIKSTSPNSSMKQSQGLRNLPPNVQAKLNLLCVPLLWGTFGPALKFVYSANSPPSANDLTVLRSGLAALLYIPVLLRSNKQADKDGAGEVGAGSQGEPAPPGGDPALMGKTPSESHQGGQLAAAGLELALWSTLGSLAQTWGLGLTSAVRASFLIQTCSVLVPAMASLGGQHVSPRIWVSCLLAFAGVLVMSASQSAEVSMDASAPLVASWAGLGLGDLAVLLGAVFYSLYTVRLGIHAGRLPATQLTAAKLICAAGIALALLVAQFASASWVGINAAEELPALSTGSITGLSLPSWASEPHVWLGILWLALGPTALADLLETRGQRLVSAPEAQIIYTTQPIWASLISILFLGEQLGPQMFLGGLAIVAGGYVASLDSDGKHAKAAGKED
eukprot:jgi/Mesvir1/8389/Mv12634-RA.1